jgi:hypothetical protein
VGIQLWTLRDTLPKDVKGVLAQVGKAGFSEVETLDIHWIRVLVHPYVILNQYFDGLKATSNHFDFNSMIKDGSTNLVQNYIETANQLGSEYITVPYIVSELRGTTGDD